MTETGMDGASGRPPRPRRGERLSSQELEFLGRWRRLIDRLGGQKKAARTMDWSTSTVSRDYSGRTLPSSERLKELANYLNLAGDERNELEILFQQARDARKARRKGEPGEAPASAAQGPSPESTGPAPGRPRRRWIIPAAAASAVVVAAGVIAGVLASSGGNRAGGNSPSPVMGTQGDVQGHYPGKGVKTVQIPMSSLGPLAKDFQEGKTKNAKTVTGFEFRNALNPSLCLTVADTGPLAGQNGDPVEVAPCRLAANQIWIPEQWDINGQAHTHLVSYKYPDVSHKYRGMCLNGQKINGDTGRGNVVELWGCYYPAGNEAWAFEAWYQNVAPGRQSYPIFVSNKPSLCLDADKHPYVTGDSIRLWTQYAVAGQFWS